MKILFLVYHGFSDVSGITKKIFAQVKGLRQNGYDVRLCYYTVRPDGHRCRMIDQEVMQDFGCGRTAAIRQRMSYDAVCDYCVREHIDVVYARCFQNASPWLIRLFGRLRRAGVKSVMEVPTYPYDAEFKGFPLANRMGLQADRLFRRRLARELDAIVTFSNADTIFGQRTIRISNGVDLDMMPLHERVDTTHELHLIGVAEVHYWHGFDRLIAGLGEYYARHKDDASARKVYFHIVGEAADSELYDSIHAPGFLPLIEKYGIGKYVVFHGALFGQELDAVFSQCAMAVGSLARHRSGITDIKTLKNREYASRGLPFVYSENDSDFDRQPYVLRVPADETPIDIDALLDFEKHVDMTPADIRQTVERLSWKSQMRTVVETLGKMKVVYCTPALYMAGGVERALTLKASYFADHFGWDVTIVLTEGKDKPVFYPLSERVRVVNLDVGFEALWNRSFVRKTWLYLRKQRVFRRRLTDLLMHERPDITVSLLRREINFICSIADGSRKVGEIHINRANYRNFMDNDTNVVKRAFAHFWSATLVGHLRRLDRFVVLTTGDQRAWPELKRVDRIPDPLTFVPKRHSDHTHKRLIAVGRYSYEKGYDMLLKAWERVEKACPDWELRIFGDGDRSEYQRQADELGIDRARCHLNGTTRDIEREYADSSVFVLSSRFEGFGMVLAEAMACGLACVAFDCPWGPRDIVAKNGEDGILVPEANIGLLAETLVGLMDDRERRVAMGRRAMESVQRFGIDAIAGQWKSLFEELTASKGTTADGENAK